jgi:glycosyltransferase involved in cell wall biosynthesis
MHGLLSYGIPGMARINSDSEQAALSIIKQNNFIATTVSTGTKEIPCGDREIDPDKIVVINNAVKCAVAKNPDYWYTKFPQARGKKIFIGIGTIGSGKNQIQILRAFLLLPKEVQNRVVVILAGKDRTNGEIEKFIAEHKLQNHVFICGFVNKEDLSNLYAIADYNVMLSISEGFGLSMIEAARFGIPSLTFSDLDAVKDIYSPTSMLLMDDRRDETVAEGIVKMLSADWNRDEIVKESLRFNEDIYLEYLDVYKMIIDSGSNIIPPHVITKTLGL